MDKLWGMLQCHLNTSLPLAVRLLTAYAMEHVLYLCHVSSVQHKNKLALHSAVILTFKLKL